VISNDVLGRIHEGSEMTDSKLDANENKSDDIRELTRQRAYKMWEDEGRPEGRLDDYWHRAQELLDDESKSAYPPAQSRGNRT
jgi:hypothetical protein